MSKFKIASTLILSAIIFNLLSFNFKDTNSYMDEYTSRIAKFNALQTDLLAFIKNSNLQSEGDIELIKDKIKLTRNSLKGLDIWLRYLDPVSYKKINGPLPVEWETEVFEKWEKPYKREGAGLTLAQLYLDEDSIEKPKLISLLESSLNATQTYLADSVVIHLKDFNHLYLCNRLYLLNLSAIYTTGFECPDPERVIPELKIMLNEVSGIYKSFNESYSETPFSPEYIYLYESAIGFVAKESNDFSQFDHFTFIRDYINPLYALNQDLIKKYKVSSKSMMDYALNKNSSSIFDKQLYFGQNSKGIFIRVNDKNTLNEIEQIGKLLFYDPLLSANNERSCASCHKSDQFFTDTTSRTSLQFDGKSFLARNTPSLINAGFNHLLMLDGKHITLQHQGKSVITDPHEMASDEKEVIRKVMSCETYKNAFKKFLKLTPQEKEVGMEHIVSALSIYYSKFSTYYSSFDNAMNKKVTLDEASIKGFNLFMSKSQCATCHFVPQFNGVKPPYVGSEFEVLGVPKDTLYSQLSMDMGRYGINPARETQNAFRTGTIRNAERTKPYMHNGVFTNLNEVVNFYITGGGAGHGLKVENQTLSSDSIHLNQTEKYQLVQFIKSLNEEIVFEVPPSTLPKSKVKSLNNRKVGGVY